MNQRMITELWQHVGEQPPRACLPWTWPKVLASTQHTTDHTARTKCVHQRQQTARYPPVRLQFTPLCLRELPREKPNQTSTSIGRAKIAPHAPVSPLFNAEARPRVRLVNWSRTPPVWCAHGEDAGRGRAIDRSIDTGRRRPSWRPTNRTITRAH
jgi:hypothetical protein